MYGVINRAGMGFWVLVCIVVLGGGCKCVMVGGLREGEPLGLMMTGKMEVEKSGFTQVSMVEKFGGEDKVREKNAVSPNVEELASVEKTYEMNVYAGVGQFLGVISIGTPPVSFTAIVDTGSDLVWRQCRPCKQCYPQTDYGFPIFDPALSSTFRNVSCKHTLCKLYGGTCSPGAGTCSYDSPYDDPPAFTRGDLAFDTLSVSDLSGRLQSVPHFAFGCSYESHGPYNFAGSGGIAGFGQGKLSLPSQLGINRFSYCFRRITAWSIDSSPPPAAVAMATSSSPSLQQRRSSLSPSLASPLFLGDAAHLSGNIQSTRIIDQQYYYVELLAIRIAGRRLNISRSLFSDGGTLVDSGTTFTTLPTLAFHAVYSAFRALIPLTPWHGTTPGPRNLSLCYSSLPSPIPSLSFQFKGAHLRLAPHNYFVFIDNLYCLAILETHDPGVIYGNVQQQDFHILYDLHSRLISFKPTSCSSLHHT